MSSPEHFEEGYNLPKSDLFPSLKTHSRQLYECKAWSLIEPKPVVTEDTFKIVQFPKVKRIFS
jgi:hypothetical protein